jgi:DNA-directed RNA polymerase subunit omega
VKQYEIEKLIDKVGGSFKLTILIQRRLLELKKGAPPLVESTSSNLMDIIYEEILTDKIWLEEPEEQELASEEEKLPTTYFSFSSQNYDED